MRSESGMDAAVPRPVLLAALALILVTGSLAFFARAGARNERSPEHSIATGAPRAVLHLRFFDRADGAIVVVDARTERTVKILGPGTKGFVRGVLRGMARQRKRASIGPTPPVRLSRWADGRFALDDPQTGFLVDLKAFGQSNAAAFAELFPEDPNAAL